MDADRQAFYAYNAPMMEAWDGPAAIDVRTACRSARLDVTVSVRRVMSKRMMTPSTRSRVRNGRAPGERPHPPQVACGAGKMLLIDTVQGACSDTEIEQVSLAKPYREWVERLNLRLPTSRART